jgi:Protein of unknown function (DUF3313)
MPAVSNNSKQDPPMTHLSISRLIRNLTLASVLAAAAPSAWAQGAEPAPLTVMYTKPGVNLAPYKEFRLLPLNVADTRLVPPPWVEKPDPQEWSLTRENREFLVTTFASAVREGIESSGKYKVVDDAGPATLLLEVRLISLTPWASRDEKDAETLGSGTLSFESYLRDARTAELLISYKGTQQVGKDYQENTAFNKASDLTEHFKTWGRNISQRLTAAQAR